ncbi:MAG: glycosyltransferase family 2 protein [Gemmatimonadaceae bacterium]
MNEPHIAVVIPCFNVGRHVESVVRAIPPMVGTIVAVDDESADDTAAVLGRCDDPRLVVLRQPRNGGVGSAMLAGYREALARGADICVKVDGDGQMDLTLLPALVATVASGDADFAKGNRFRDIEALAAMPRVRLLGNGALSFLTKLVSGYWSIFDPTNGYTAISAVTLKRMDMSRIAPRYFFETSVLIELNIQGAVVRDVEMGARYGNERSQLSVGRVAATFPFLLVRGLWRRFFWRYMIRDFTAVTVCVLTGVPALMFGLMFGGYHWWLSIASGHTASAGTVLVAALPVILGSQCLLTAFVLDIVQQPARTSQVAPLDRTAR